MPYTDTTKVANYLDRALTTRETTMCALLIPAIKHHIDGICSMTFEKVADGDDKTEGTRFFESDGGQALFLEDCVVRDISAVTGYDSLGLSEGVISTDDYEAFPLNKDAKRYLKKSAGGWNKGVKAVSITGEFSYADTAPEDIQLVATIMVAELLRNPQRLSSESIEGYSKVFADYIGAEHPEVMMTLGRYARIKV